MKLTKKRLSGERMSTSTGEITESDRKLLDELRKRIHKELELVKEYDDDFSLMRWLIGWDRKIGKTFWNIV